MNEEFEPNDRHKTIVQMYFYLPELTLDADMEFRNEHKQRWQTIKELVDQGYLNEREHQGVVTLTSTPKVEQLTFPLLSCWAMRDAFWERRPSKCRFRLKDEGKGYPRSGCAACGATVANLGTSCRLVDNSNA